MPSATAQVIMKVNLNDVFNADCQELAKPRLSLSWGRSLEALSTLEGTKSPWDPRMCLQARCPFLGGPHVAAGPRA